MKKETAFVVLAKDDFSGRTDPVMVFLDAADAKTFSEKCERYQNRRPKSPGVIENTPENDSAFDDFWRRHLRWQMQHPAGKELSGRHSFPVVPLPLVPSAHPEKLHGFDIVIDPTLPDDLAEIKDGDRLLARIVGVATKGP